MRYTQIFKQTVGDTTYTLSAHKRTADDYRQPGAEPEPCFGLFAATGDRGRYVGWISIEYRDGIEYGIEWDTRPSLPTEIEKRMTLFFRNTRRKMRKHYERMTATEPEIEAERKERLQALAAEQECE